MQRNTLDSELVPRRTLLARQLEQARQCLYETPDALDKPPYTEHGAFLTRPDPPLEIVYE